jgi:hypothetical protein
MFSRLKAVEKIFGEQTKGKEFVKGGDFHVFGLKSEKQ